VNWIVKPFSMAALAWLFFRVVFASFIGRADADQYIAGCIILAAAPCTAMVFVWSHLTNGDPAYTLVQVSVNDLIMLVLFVPIVQFLVSGASSLQVPFQVLLYSVIVFIVIPLLAGVLLRTWLVRTQGKGRFEGSFLPRFAPITIAALLSTLVLIFAFQADNITGRFLHVLLIAVPITLQVYFNASLTYWLMKLCRVEHSVAAPGSIDRRVEFLRAGGGNGDRSVWTELRSCVGDGGGRLGGSSRDAVRLFSLQSHEALVSGLGAQLTTGKGRS
jgi:ACR3 family arsenite transporter